MRSDPGPAVDVAHVLVTAHGWHCVQRVVVLLTARAYAVSSFSATPTAREPYWHVRVALQCSAAELQLLQARLERIPAVASVLTSVGTDVPAARPAAGDARGAARPRSG